MKIILLSVGKTDNKQFAQLVDEYRKRVNYYIPFETQIVPDIKNRKTISEKEQKTLEGNLLLKSLMPTDYVVLLDDKGKQFSSVEFAGYLERKSHTVPKRLIFMIGGPYGFSQEIYDAANEKISLSKMTYTHQMVRLIFAEQLYRAMTILHNEPYHHE
ncbi:MAG: 23S rRNA (pseudouridine(1915)-N(3))-methyltransferase RlmH [Bacteroidetes bacterium GWD2_45_23]|nr:MAG: 23S rRNA (pseudouridine(1915)-N(3))-methyltransferase RlmH [Bacteroidetes bacterium GWC2_46_850]OFX66926.1 MAG: 23S rRNA (pseudouridine(1915)-N(3))-methyltransferase RlmH [Bacteroidetes bacterium GWC1_47_7]OFX83734.1 MAG: 23S rRNA (pseudouridine(1915)-N(3))-methyltransferase RlmH [Bacteroidetes bacterium GWD2_45_23]HAR39144.1 23S rRNA (pseudouridine(1915)-N(3))-methyltransferase RlmH [Porphyromonadaceae bacterium]HBB00955.1 23S rRNA (pseudouridine(1915)-N(3))-methyltransferase RlmH [Por